MQKVLGYTPYIIDGRISGFHAFCQVYHKEMWYYVDARGITSSFDEFMMVAKEFVSGEYIIRPITASDIEEWKDSDDYNDEGYAFAEAVIEKYKEYYTL